MTFKIQNDFRIAGGLAAYFRAYPTVKFINKTIITPQKVQPSAIVITEKPNIEPIAVIGKYLLLALHFSAIRRACDVRKGIENCDF